MRSLCTMVLLLIGAGAAFAGAPKGSALEDWKAHRAVDHADTLIVAAPFDTTWKAALEALQSLSYDVAGAEVVPGHFAGSWDESKEVPGSVRAEEGLEDAMRSPDCPGCTFTVVHSRILLDVEKVSTQRARIVARMQFVGTPKGHAEPIALESTGLFERVLLKRIRERMGL